MVSSVVIVCLNGRRQRLEHLEVVLCGYLWTMNMSASQHPLLPMPGLQGSDGFLPVCVSLLQTDAFQKPVPLEQHPDYAEYIFHPMDLCTLEKVGLYHRAWP